jgi:hypothetical protein
LRGLDRGSEWFWISLALFASFWILAGLNQMPGRSPESSRHQYVGVVLGMVVAAELLRGVRIGRQVTLAVIEDVKLTRFASGKLPVTLKRSLAARQAGELRISTDHSSTQWKLWLKTSAAVTICGLTANGRSS